METCKVFKTSAAKEGSRAAVVIQRLVRGVQARQRTLLVRSNAAGRTVNNQSNSPTKTGVFVLWLCFTLLQDHKMHLVKVLHHLWTQRPRFIGYEVHLAANVWCPFPVAVAARHSGLVWCHFAITHFPSAMYVLFSLFRRVPFKLQLSRMISPLCARFYEPGSVCASMCSNSALKNSGFCLVHALTWFLFFFSQN